MELLDYNFELPEELIARYPLNERTASRLLHLSQAGIIHRTFRDIKSCLRPNDLLIFNNTRVINARLFGQKPSGGRIELLIERITDQHHAWAHIKASKRPKIGSTLMLGQHNRRAEILERSLEGLYHLKFAGPEPLSHILQTEGILPLPPYFKRESSSLDDSRYQTVYADKEGAVAAPTAGLHFDQALMAELAQDFDIGFITLHVGAGTFKPVQTDNLDEHVMHSEWLEVDEALCRKIEHTRGQGGRVIAVGTTTLRALETAALHHGALKPFEGETRLFVRPGFKFQVVECLITNFHLPSSTLLMLVCALGGTQAVLNSYQTAIAQRYRFYSYGDAMFVERAIS